MNRREFLFLRRTAADRVLELSCRDLYMRALDVEAATRAPGAAVYDHEPWMGEPPTDFHGGGADEWLRQIERELAGADVLRLLDDEWLEAARLGERLAPIIASFCARGGRVESSRG